MREGRRRLHRSRQLRFLGTAAIIALAMACGGGSTAPSPDPGALPNTTTVIIANNAVAPQNITVPLGSQVTFVNNDSRDHQIASDPHPEHTDCPEINQVGYLTAGQSRQTGNLVVARTCGYHDHINFEIKSLQGTITIHP